MLEKVGLISVFAGVAIFYAATVRPGHIWGDDFAMYVHHAQNIVEGRPYADTGYIDNPASLVSPPMYPPIFPLLLAPLCKAFGLNLMPMKLEQVVFFLLVLAAAYRFWKDEIGPSYSVAMIAILGFSPVFWNAKDNVLSDVPFLLFFYLAAVLVQAAPRGQPGWWRWAVLIGLILYLAMGTRAAGIALVAGLLLYDALRYRTITRVTAVALPVWAVLVLLQRHWVGSGVGNYAGLPVRPTLATVEVNLMTYSRSLAGFWVASTQNAFSFFVLGIVAVLIAYGIVLRNRRGFTIVEAFLAPYILIVMVWPFSSGIRLVFPLIPWIVFLALSGLRGLAAAFAPRYSTAAVGGLLLLTAVPYTMAYRRADFGPIRQSTGSPEFNQLCQAVRERTSLQDVFIYFRARALALYTGRVASSYNARGSEQELWHYAQTIHATHLITSDAFHEDHDFLARYAADNLAGLELIYENRHFRLYRILPVGKGVASAAERR